MSLGVERPGLVDGRFPRVSGDEPICQSHVTQVVWCFPRVSGDEPIINLSKQFSV